MPISSEIRVTEVTVASTGEVNFGFPWPLYESAQVQVSVKAPAGEFVQLAPNTYEVTLGIGNPQTGYAGGNVKYPLIGPATVGTVVRIERILPFTQLAINLGLSSGYDPRALNRAFDHLVMLIQQVRDTGGTGSGGGGGAPVEIPINDSGLSGNQSDQVPSVRIVNTAVQDLITNALFEADISLNPDFNVNPTLLTTRAAIKTLLDATVTTINNALAARPILTFSPLDPSAAPAGTGQFWVKDSGQLWYSINTVDVNGWIPLLSGSGTGFMASGTFNPENKAGQVVVEADIAAVLEDNELVELGADIDLAGATPTLLLTHFTKDIYLTTSGADLTIPTGLPEGFFCMVYSANPWNVIGGTGVTVNGTLQDNLPISALPGWARLYHAGGEQWRVVGTVTGGSPPTVTSPIPNQSMDWWTGTQTVDASLAFSGTVTTYSLDTTTTGVSINSSTGLISINTELVGRHAGTDITVRATNSNGFVTDTFDLDVIGFPVLKTTEFTSGNSATWTAPAQTLTGDLLEMILVGQSTLDPTFSGEFTQIDDSADAAYKGAWGYRIATADGPTVHSGIPTSPSRTGIFCNLWRAGTFDPTTPFTTISMDYSSSTTQITWPAMTTLPRPNSLVLQGAWSPGAMQPGLVPGSTNIWNRTGANPNGRAMYTKGTQAGGNTAHSPTGAAATRWTAYLQGVA